MKFTRMRAIVACTILAGALATPAFGQGVIARGDCPRAMQRMAHVPAHSPVSQYKPVVELERFIASLATTAPAPAEAQPRERASAKRSKRLPSRF